MTKVQATAKCPNCPWKLSKIYESDEDALELIHGVNEQVDSLLMEHLKTHESISNFILAAAREIPLENTPFNAFRGDFDLKFKELK